MSARLDAIADKFEIQETLTAYVHAIDSRDFDALDALFTRDARIDYSATGGMSGTLAEIKPFLQAMLPMFKATQHFVTNPLIVLSGQKATCKSMMLNPMTMAREDGPHTLFIGAWYVDEFVHQDSVWKISDRRQELAFFHNQ